MKIPIFVSCPTSLNATQERSRSALMRFLDEFNLERVRWEGPIILRSYHYAKSW
jgi:hypothetical protein